MTRCWIAPTLLLFLASVALPACQGTAPAASPTASATNSHVKKAAPKAAAKQDSSGKKLASKSTGYPPPPDVVRPDPAVPAGAIEVQLLDKDGHPVSDARVRLDFLRECSIRAPTKNAETDNSGRVQFNGLAVSSDISYRVSVREGHATYATDPFSLKTNMGQQVVLHIYPWTDVLRSALVGMRGFGYITRHDDTYQFDLEFDVYNIGAVTWVAKDVHFDLPRGWRALDDTSTGDRRVVADGDSGVQLVGTFPPGKQAIDFSFQVPNNHDATASFKMGLPPHVALMEMWAESTPGMSMRIDGFPPAQHTTNKDGQPVLRTSRELRAGEPQMKQLSITLSGVPTPPAHRHHPHRKARKAHSEAAVSGARRAK